MRKLIPVVALAALILVSASVAFATVAFKQSAKFGFTTHKPGVSTGISTNMASSDAGVSPVLFSKPKDARKVVITFPANTKFNLGTSAVNACHVTDKKMLDPKAQFRENTELQCPKSSQVGGGTAQLNTMPMGDPVHPALIDAQVKVFRHIYRTLYIVVYPSLKQIPGWQPWILHATASGSKLTINIPAQVYGRGHCGKETPCLPEGITASLVMLKFNTWSAGSGSSALVRSGKCTSGKFKVSSYFTYEDHSHATIPSSSKCSS